MDRAQARKKAEALVAKMTIEERAGQLKYDAPAIERLGIPTYNWWNEALHGVARAGTATVFPQAIGCAAMFDEEEMQKIADVIAEEGRAKYNAFSKEEDRDIYKGLTFWSPNINIFRDPRWGRGHETYGEDPFLTARLGVSFIKGLQGDGETMKVAACAKHFAVHSGPEAIRHEFDAVVSQKDLYETYLPAFEAAVKEGGVEAVMGGYNRTNGEPSCGSKTLLKKILREDWGFEGHVVSDCWAIQDFHQFHKVTNGPKESAQMALEAGCDLNCGCTYAYIMAALQDGLVTEEQITEACIRVFTTRFLLGMFDGSEYDDIPYEVVECKEHRNLAVEAAHKGMVLLKNDGILPLDKRKIRTIGVVGPNANNRIALQGNYHGTSSRYVTVLEGIQKEVEDDCRVYYAEGSHMYKDTMENLAWKDDRISEAVITAKQCDVTIVVLGLDELMEMILLTAEVMELKANPNRRARGLVLEAQLDKGRGPVATVLVQKGTLRVGDAIAAGSAHGKVRAMMDDKGRRVKEAGPSVPVEILGLDDVPNAGEVVVCCKNEKEARSFAETFIAQNKVKLLEDTKSKLSLDDLFTQIQEGNLKELDLIVKADVQGSVEAVKQSLLKLSNDEVIVKVIHGGVGAINESDVSLASASNAIIIGFNVRPDATAKETAEREGVDVRLYRVIYNAIEDVEAAMKGMLDPVFEEKVLGHAEVRQTFKASGVGTIAGSYVLDGLFERDCSVRLTRDGIVIFEGPLASLKRFKDDVKEVKAGYECGFVFANFNDIKEGDLVEAFKMVEVPR